MTTTYGRSPGAKSAHWSQLASKAKSLSRANAGIFTHDLCTEHGISEIVSTMSALADEGLDHDRRGNAPDTMVCLNAEGDAVSLDQEQRSAILAGLCMSAIVAWGENPHLWYRGEHVGIFDVTVREGGDVVIRVDNDDPEAVEDYHRVVNDTEFVFSDLSRELDRLARGV